MARVCELCGKGPQFGHKVSHAHNVTNRRWNVNLQSVRAIVNGAHKRLRACTSCIRNGKDPESRITGFRAPALPYQNRYQGLVFGASLPDLRTPDTGP